MTTTLNDVWIHQSFRNDLPVPEDALTGTPTILAAPWAPPGRFEVSTSEEGFVEGELTFPRGPKLAVTGRIAEPIAAGAMAPWPMPASVELTAVVESTEYRLQGWFIQDSNAIAGTVLAVKGDLAGAPDGTMGSWILVQSVGEE